MATNKTNVTIRMPKSLKAKWLRALRSGKYTQGEGNLKAKYKDETGKVCTEYCCLGVLQEVAGKKRIEGGFPKTAWLKRNGITFLDEEGRVTNNPWLVDLEETAADANDSSARTFPEIADAIDACCVGYEKK